MKNSVNVKYYSKSSIHNINLKFLTSSLSSKFPTNKLLYIYFFLIYISAKGNLPIFKYLYQLGKNPYFIITKIFPIYIIII